VTPSATHLVLIPSYNPGVRAVATVAAARANWDPVWVVVDGSTDGSAEELTALARDDPSLRVLVRARNGGKGAAILDGLMAAQRAGFTHALTMDADGQHAPECIGAFMQASLAAPGAMIFGDPVFDASVPLIAIMQRTRWMRRFDFDAEAAVRLSWRGVPVVNLRAPVRYFRPDEGGVSHFHYGRDNVLLTSMYLRLFVGFVGRLPWLIARRLQSQWR
jgi:glycosyltransferase involved in cell wall biosynthesis